MTAPRGMAHPKAVYDWQRLYDAAVAGVENRFTVPAGARSVVRLQVSLAQLGSGWLQRRCLFGDWRCRTRQLENGCEVEVWFERRDEK